MSFGDIFFGAALFTLGACLTSLWTYDRCKYAHVADLHWGGKISCEVLNAK